MDNTLGIYNLNKMSLSETMIITYLPSGQQRDVSGSLMQDIRPRRGDVTNNIQFVQMWHKIVIFYTDKLDVNVSLYKIQKFLCQIHLMLYKKDELAL